MSTICWKVKKHVGFHSPQWLVVKIVGLLIVSLSPIFGAIAFADIGDEIHIFSTSFASTSSVAWGDWDGDGDLDLAVGNYRRGRSSAGIKVFENVAGALFCDPKNGLGWQSLDSFHTASVAWGDWDGDGDLDLAVGNGGINFGLSSGTGTVSYAEHNYIYENEGGTLQLDPPRGIGWQSPDTLHTTSVAWGDWDDDGDFDLAVGNGGIYFGETNQIFENENGTLRLEPDNGLGWQSPDALHTTSVAWGDWDDDGDLDLAVGNGDMALTDYNQVYENENSTLWLDPVSGLGWESPQTSPTTSVAWGDWDSDGDVDLAVGNWNDRSATTLDIPNRVYEYEAGTLHLDPARNLGWQSPDSLHTNSVVWGDWDGDGDLDLAVGNGYIEVEDPDEDGYKQIGEISQVFENENDTLLLEPGWQSPDDGHINSLAWGDIDADGDLDLVAASNYRVNKVHKNDGGTLLLDSDSGLGWQTNDALHTNSIAWGDWDNDGDFDLAVGSGHPSIKLGEPLRVYENENDRLLYKPASGLGWQSSNLLHTTSVAWGDWDGDGDLDLAIGNADEPNYVYENDAKDDHTLKLDPAQGVGWESPDIKYTTSVAWGDWDGDGDLDLAVGNSDAATQVFENDGDGFGLGWQSPYWGQATEDLAWGDWDNDGDLDLAVATATFVQVFENEAKAMRFDPSDDRGWRSPDTQSVTSVAWGDWDGDGDLDLAIGKYSSFNQIFENDEKDNHRLKLDPAQGVGWQSPDAENTLSIAFGDWDNDDDLDLAAGNFGSGNQIFENEGGRLRLDTREGWGWQSSDEPPTSDIAWGDWDGDGDIDLAFGNSGAHPDYGDNNLVYENTVGSRRSSVLVNHPGHVGHADFYSVPTIHGGLTTTIPITFTLFDPDALPTRLVRAEYSLDGGGTWLNASPTSTSQTRDLGVGTHVFYWDTFSSGFFGQSDNVTFRIHAYQSLRPYHNGMAGPYQFADASAQTYPFRVRGTQVKVVTNGKGISAALVYQIEKGSTHGARPMASDEGGNPFRTDKNGYLEGRGTLTISDTLVALLPMATTESYTVYATNITPTHQGLEAFTVEKPGVQELVVSEENPLILFNLDVSLEWDARLDVSYLNDLEFNLKRASEILFDLTNGQAALGDVQLFFNREHWNDADIRIHATNDLRPYATVGGVSPLLRSETFSRTEESGAVVYMRHLYGPGHVEMGALWNRYGNAGEDLGEDWARTLAHELGHYLFYLHDNYIGLDNGRLTRVDGCPGVMAAPYAESDSEFHPQPNWLGSACEETFSHQVLGRSDWEVMQFFYPPLIAPTVPIEAEEIKGPALLPLAVTQIITSPVDSEPETLEVPSFDVSIAGGGRYIAGGGARAFLLQGDRLLDLGAPRQDRVQAWNARPNGVDKLCVYDLTDAERPLTGCEAIIAGDQELTLAQPTNWQPEVLVSPVTSRTIAITVSIGSAPVTTLSARIYPQSPLQNALPKEPLDCDSIPGVCTGVLPVGLAAQTASVHIFDNEDNPQFAALTDYSLGGSPTLVLSNGGILQLSPGDTLVLSNGGVLEVVDGAPVPVNPGDTLVLSNGGTLVFDQDGYTLVLSNGGTLDLNGDTLVLSNGGSLDMGFGGTLRLSSGSTLVLSNGGALQLNPNDTLVLSNGGTLNLGSNNVRDLEPGDTLVLSNGGTLLFIGGGYTLVLSNGGTMELNGETLVLSNGGSLALSPGDTLVLSNGGIPDVASAETLVLSNGGGLVVDRGETLVLSQGEAPIRSSDGQMVLFGEATNTGFDEFYSLQATSSVPQAPSYATRTGRAYRVTASPGARSLAGASIGFYYLGRNVDDDKEPLLKVYFWDGSNWHRLPTIVDEHHNIATATVPDIQGGIGLYALMHSTEISLNGPGWNIFAYVGPDQRPVAEAMESIAGDYSIIWGYEPNPSDGRHWQAYDPSIDPDHPLENQVNNLQSLRYGRGYWVNIDATQNITLYLQSSTGVSVAGLVDVESIGTSTVPPAVYYGALWQTEDFVPTPGMSVTAWINGQLCGESKTEGLDGMIGYVLQVPAVGDSQYTNCGAAGRRVSFQVDGVPMLSRPDWNNTLTQHTVLFNRFVNPIFLPVIVR